MMVRYQGEAAFVVRSLLIEESLTGHCYDFKPNPYKHILFLKYHDISRPPLWIILHRALGLSVQYYLNSPNSPNSAQFQWSIEQRQLNILLPGKYSRLRLRIFISQPRLLFHHLFFLLLFLLLLYLLLPLLGFSTHLFNIPLVAAQGFRQLALNPCRRNVHISIGLWEGLKECFNLLARLEHRYDAWRWWLRGVLWCTLLWHFDSIRIFLLRVYQPRELDDIEVLAEKVYIGSGKVVAHSFVPVAR